MKLEQELKKELRATKVRLAILSSIQFAGIITIAAMAPKVLSLLDKTQKRWSAQNIKSAVQRLKEKGLLEFDEGRMCLTDRGSRYLAKENLSVKRPSRWDKKWRLVIFDIPERRKLLRDKLRDTLLRIGFMRLQNSVWIYPFDCEELITLLKTDYQIGNEVLYMIVDKIERDSILKKHFSL